MDEKNSCVRENVSISNLVALRDCQKSFKMRELNLKLEGMEKESVMNKALSLLKGLKDHSRCEVEEEITKLFQQEYLKEWFEIDCQYDAALKRDRYRVVRILNYLEGGFTVLASDVSFSIPIKSMYRNYQINNITDKVDLVLEKEGVIHLVKFKRGEPKYSYRARKLINMVENSIELLCIGYGMKDACANKKVQIELWYLKNKDDNELNIPPFEHKRGKNIVGISFTNSEDMKNRFYTVATFTAEEDKCLSCRYYGLCDYQLLKETENEQNEQGELHPKAKPVLTDKQKTVVNHLNGAMCVIAVPGAGKTCSLVNRLANMISLGIKAEEILFVTFTKKAATEIKARSMELLGTKNEREIPNIFTFNSFGYTILKENPIFLGKRVRLADDMDRLVLINEAVANCPMIKGMSYQGLYLEHGLLRRLKSMFEKIEDIGKEKFSLENESKIYDIPGVFKVYDYFTMLFKERGYISYDMQISLVNELFLKYPKLIEKYVQKYRYIMIDEYQDTSEEQARMMYAIAKKHGNIVVVGDDDQSIYNWRGGSNQFMLNFGSDFPDAKIVIMNDNFRSSNTILNTANSLITGNGTRYVKELKGHKENSNPPVYLKGYTSSMLPSLIKTILDNGYNAGDIAVIARNNKRIMEVAGALKNSMMEVSLEKEYLIHDSVFILLHDILKMYYEGLEHDASFYRFFKAVGAEIYKRQDKKLSLYEDLVTSRCILPIELFDIDCTGNYQKYNNVTSYMNAGYKLLQCLKAVQYGRGMCVLDELSEILFDAKCFIIDILKDIAEERGLVTVKELYSYMSNMVKYQDTKTIEHSVCKNRVNLITAHSSKGKEYPVVIIYATEDFKDDEEEIRVLYVAVTRAKSSLFMVETEFNRCDVLYKFKDQISLKEV